MLDITSEELRTLIENRIVLSMKLSTKETVIPQFQFDGNEMRGEWISLFQDFPETWTGWEITCWFFSDNLHLGTLPIRLLPIDKNLDKLRLLINTEFALSRVE